MNYEEAINYIHSINWTFCKPGLERIGELCSRLGNPEKNLRFIHIAGTNGKGSTASMLDSILREAGYRTGLYTSPYIRVFNERMRIDGKNIEDDELADITSYVRPFADAMTDKPTEFELITAIAFEYFNRHKCDVVVLEAGMGGRLDSTNVIDSSLLSIITGVSLDHIAFLGDTVEKIAVEKTGIIKPGCPVLFGGEDERAYGVIKSKAEELKSPLTVVDRSRIKIKNCTLDGTVFDFEDRSDIKIQLLGVYQPSNAATVLKAVDILRREKFEISELALRKGLESARWQARFEIIRRNPLVIFDGAHNVEGIKAATDSIKTYFGKEKVCVVSGVLADKDYNVMANDISGIACKVFTMTPNNPRALNSEKYAEVFRGLGVDSTAYGTIEDALANAYEFVKENNMTLICLGSLYTYSSVCGYFESKEIRK